MAITTTDGIPLVYGHITIVDSDDTAKTIEIEIEANSVSATTEFLPVLININSYFSNSNGDTDDIFTELGENWNKFYVKDGTITGTNLEVAIERWVSADNIARVWVNIPSLTTAAKTLTLVFDSTGSVNTLIKYDKVIGT